MADIYVAFAGLKGSGKTEAADILGRQLARRGVPVLHYNFATPIKQILNEGVGVPGEKLYLKDGVFHGGKEVRKILQDFGMAIRRFDDNFWVNAWRSRTQHFHGVVLVSDLRFYAEAVTLRQQGAIMFWVDRGLTNTDSHISEQSADTFRQWLTPLDNTGTRAELRKKLRPLAKEIAREYFS